MVTVTITPQSYTSVLDTGSSGDFTTTSTTLVDATGFSWTIAANFFWNSRYDAGGTGTNDNGNGVAVLQSGVVAYSSGGIGVSRTTRVTASSTGGRQIGTSSETVKFQINKGAAETNFTLFATGGTPPTINNAITILGSSKFILNEIIVAGDTRIPMKLDLTKIRYFNFNTNVLQLAGTVIKGATTAVMSNTWYEVTYNTMVSEIIFSGGALLYGLLWDFEGDRITIS